MILTTCAACAKPLEHDAPARCVGCQTRYCSDRCLRYHAHRGGHDDECEEIANGGGAEQHHANKKYGEAVAEAVEECAEDTEGQTCFICMDGEAEEGLVRGCSCRGAAGFAHVSCLARQAQVSVEEAEERDLLGDAFDARWARWHTCGLCEQYYHGVVVCALGWGCWKTYVGRPEGDRVRGMAMSQLGNGVSGAEHNEEALAVYEAELAMLRRISAWEETILIAQSNVASAYDQLGRDEEAILMREDIYHRTLDIWGEEHRETLLEANNYALSLVDLQRFEEAKSLLRKSMPVARRVMGQDDYITLRMRWGYAEALCRDPGSTLDDLREAATTLEDVGRIAQRVFGGSHPTTKGTECILRMARTTLAARETPGES